jgi:hypothetical protein
MYTYIHKHTYTIEIQYIYIHTYIHIYICIYMYTCIYLINFICISIISVMTIAVAVRHRLGQAAAHRSTFAELGLALGQQPRGVDEKRYRGRFLIWV